MADDCTIRPATEADWPAIAALSDVVMGGALPLELMRWKHQANPFGASAVLVAEDDQGLVGMRTMARWELRAGGETLRAVRPVDTMTHPRFRRRGLFRRLTTRMVDDMRDEGVDLIFNTPNEKSGAGYLKMGWQSVGRLAVWARPTSPLGRTDGHPVDGAGFPLAQGRHRRLHTPHSAAYIDWRYGRAPGLDYQAYGDAEVGLIARRRARGERQELTISEISCPATPGGIARAAALLHRAAHRSAGTYALAMAAPGTRQAAALALAGFAWVPGRGPWLVARPLSSRADWALQRGWWRPQIGDLEVF